MKKIHYRQPRKIIPFKFGYLKGAKERLLTMDQIYCIRNMKKFEGKSAFVN